MNDDIKNILYTILESIDEGVHVINNEGKTIIYNKAMEKMEGMKKSEVIDKNILDVFPSLDKATSTLLRALKNKEVILDIPQTYFNNHEKEITTINTTLPITVHNQVIGALEISKDITKLKYLSEQMISLQNQLSNPNHKKNYKRKFTFSSIIGKNENFTKAIEYAKKASNFSSSVLIYGETGTGKELVAQSIHYGSARANKPFIAQNCAAIPETLLESILFGTVKGSFTGAMNKEGLFEHANEGTLFLDEINSMGMQLQSKLLRVLQESNIRRVGSLDEIDVDVRIIASTNEDPYKLIKEGKLRKDLFYRINVMSINLPSLREREDDIELLIYYFIDKYNNRLNKKVKGVDESLLGWFRSYKWSGNVRELENIIEGAMNIVENNGILRKEHFSPQTNAKIFALTFNKEYKLKENLPNTLLQIEKNMITKALKSCNFNISKTSENLGIKRQTLQHKLKKLNIKVK
ncbi:sigma 54-interacting transcriptional regulator [Lutibacter sp. B2]|nr:sigma 54-interacting transcriptional regulator [Lutibacter sp. B2]